MPSDDETNIAVFRMLTDRLDDCDDRIRGCEAALNSLTQHERYKEGRKWGRLNNHLFGYPFPITIVSDISPLSQQQQDHERQVPWLPAVFVKIYMSECTDCGYAMNPDAVTRKWVEALPEGHGHDMNENESKESRDQRAAYRYVKSKMPTTSFFLFAISDETHLGFTSEGEDRDIGFYMTQAMKILQLLDHDVTECVAAVTVVTTEPEVLQFMQDVAAFVSSVERMDDMDNMDRWAAQRKLKLDSLKGSVSTSHVASAAKQWVTDVTLY